MEGPRIAWRYRCSLCKTTLAPGPEITAHLEHHKRQPDWRGVMRLERVDKDDDGHPPA